MPMLGQDRLGMELHALDRMLAMAQAHDLVERAIFIVGPRGDLEAVGQGVARDHQRVVPRRFIGIRQSGEYALPAVADARGLAVHDGLSADHVAAVGLADALVAEAHPEDGYACAELL